MGWIARYDVLAPTAGFSGNLLDWEVCPAAGFSTAGNSRAVTPLGISKPAALPTAILSYPSRLLRWVKAMVTRCLPQCQDGP